MLDTLDRGTVKVPYKGKTVKVSGVVPGMVFVPGEERPKQYNSLTGIQHLYPLCMGLLGVNRYRLNVLLGGAPGNSWRIGRTITLSSCYWERLNFLLILKLVNRINVAGLYAIDWRTGIVYFNEGESVRIEGYQSQPDTE